MVIHTLFLAHMGVNNQISLFLFVKAKEQRTIAVLCTADLGSSVEWQKQRNRGIYFSCGEGKYRG